MTGRRYTSGRPRVHSGPAADIERAIAEYEAYADAHPGDGLTPELLECAADLREELEIAAFEERAMFGSLKERRDATTELRARWPIRPEAERGAGA